MQSSKLHIGNFLSSYLKGFTFFQYEYFFQHVYIQYTCIQYTVYMYIYIYEVLYYIGLRMQSVQFSGYRFGSFSASWDESWVPLIQNSVKAELSKFWSMLACLINFILNTFQSLINQHQVFGALRILNWSTSQWIVFG